MDQEQKIYDLIIIGAGPAGLTASIYASRYGLNHLVIGMLIGGKVAEAHKISNFPTEQEITGLELAEKIKKHAESLGTNLIQNQIVDLEKKDNYFVLKSDSLKEYYTKTILIATGTKEKQLGLPNENKYLGKGLSYCFTCDGVFFKNKVVAIVGGGDAALSGALYLSEIAEKVYLIHRRNEFRAEKVWLEKLKANNKIIPILNNEVVNLIGEEKLERIELLNTFNESKLLKVDGLFIEIGGVPTSVLLNKIQGEVDEEGYIKIDKKGRTNVLGVWAAGDVTNGSDKFSQIVTACAEGAIASRDIYFYLKNQET